MSDDMNLFLSNREGKVDTVYMSNHIKYRLIDVLSRPAHHIIDDFNLYLDSAESKL